MIDILTACCLLILQCTSSTLNHCSAVAGQTVQFSRNEVSNLIFCLYMCIMSPLVSKNTDTYLTASRLY